MRVKDPVAVAIGHRLRAARTRADMEMEEVADALGVATDTYGNYERGWRTIPVAILRHIPRVLGVSVSSILGIPEETDLSGEETQIITQYREIESPVARHMIRSIISQYHIERFREEAPPDG